MVFSYIETIKPGCRTNVPALPDSVHFRRQLEPPNRPSVEIVIQTERRMSRISDNVAPRHYHPDHVWSAGIELELKRWEVINSTNEALRALTELWPPKRLNCPHFRPDTQHKQEGSSTCLGIGLCLTSFDRLN